MQGEQSIAVCPADEDTLPCPVLKTKARPRDDDALHALTGQGECFLGETARCSVANAHAHAYIDFAVMAGRCRSGVLLFKKVYVRFFT